MFGEVVDKINAGEAEVRVDFGAKNTATAEVHRFNRWRIKVAGMVRGLHNVIVRQEGSQVVFESALRGKRALPYWKALGREVPPVEEGKEPVEIARAAQEEEGSEVADIIRELYPPVKNIKDLFSKPEPIIQDTVPPAPESLPVPEEPPNVKEPLWQDEPSPSSGRGIPVELEVISTDRHEEGRIDFVAVENGEPRLVASIVNLDTGRALQVEDEAGTDRVEGGRPEPIINEV
jgi:hypothetical protein